MLKELELLNVTWCNNLKSISLEESFLQDGKHRQFIAHLPNRGVAEWFNYKSSGCTVSFQWLKALYVEGCISLRSISLLPSHLLLLSVVECTSLQELPDLSMLKELEGLDVTWCNNLKSISLKPSFLHVGQHLHPFEALLPNREVAEWFNYKSSGCTVSFDIPPSFGSNFLGLALWVVYTCKASKEKWTYMRAVITNDTVGITENYPINADTRVGEAKSSVKCITGEKISMKSGDRIKVSIPSLLYSDYTLKVPVGRKVKVKMFGVHVIQR